jgi:hypothetical protein
MRRAWHGETKGKSRAIQSGSSQSESSAGSERMTRKNVHGRTHVTTPSAAARAELERAFSRSIVDAHAIATT